MAFIDAKELLQQTDGGRMVIEAFLPQTMESFRNPKRKFKLRLEEKTASASVFQAEDGNWLVTDFGGEGKPMNAIQLVMHLEGIKFNDAINLIAAQFGIVPDDKRAQVFKPEIRQRPATADEAEGTWLFETKPFTAKEIQLILPPKVWEYLVGIVARDTEAAKQETRIVAEVVEVFKKYHFHALAGYSIVKNRQVTEVRSTDIYPIFMFDEGDWKKIYQPRSVDGSRRFMYYGNKPKNDFMFGYTAAKNMYDVIIDLGDDEDEDLDEVLPEGVEKPKKKDKRKIEKLKNIFLCSGGSDGLTLAVIGQCFRAQETAGENFYPVWLNSETAILSKAAFDNLRRLAEHVYNIPDIDATGRRQAHKLALEYLELKTVYLPDELRDRKDSFRSKPLKDLRDYFKYYKVYDFFNLIKTAYPYRFWDATPPTSKTPKWTYSVNNKHLYNFLARCGYYRFETETEKDGYIYILIEGNIVKRIDPKKVRDFINRFIETRHPDVELMNTFLRTNQLNENSLSNLPFIKIDFTDYNKEEQWFFFQNLTCCVTAEGITEYKPGAVDKYVWEDEVIKHQVKLLPRMFSVYQCSDAVNRMPWWHINLMNTDCLVLKYLINTSRVFWREELEYRIDGIPEKDREGYAVQFKLTEREHRLMNGFPAEESRRKFAEKYGLTDDEYFRFHGLRTTGGAEQYLADHHFTIDGPLLTNTERNEQMAHLINKLYGLGKIFHRHKEYSKAWAIWGMDAKQSDGDESHGGTGKSLLPNLLNSHKLINCQYREGRNPKLLDNPHFWENTDKHTDMMLIDDSNRYMKVDFFFSAITGPITVNPKNNKQYTIPFEQTPQIWFTSNFPPHNADISIERRLLYLIYSDYYHYNRMHEYREDRTVRDDLGKNLGTDFNPTEWNLFLNLIMQATRFYMSCTQKMNPPMDNVHKRNLKAAMGEAFEGWADAYFSPDSGRLDFEVRKDEALKDYVTETNQRSLTTNKFTKSLEAWARYNNYELNPKDLCNNKTQSGRMRIMRNISGPDKDGNATRGTKEMIYLRSKPLQEVNEEDLPF